MFHILDLQILFPDRFIFYIWAIQIDLGLSHITCCISRIFQCIISQYIIPGMKIFVINNAIYSV